MSIEQWALRQHFLFKNVLCFLTSFTSFEEPGEAVVACVVLKKLLHVSESEVNAVAGPEVEVFDTSLVRSRCGMILSKWKSNYLTNRHYPV